MRLGMGLGLGNLLSGGPITGMSNKYSFSFDGSNDYLSCENTAPLQITGDMTVTAWIKTNTKSGNQRFITKWGSSIGWYIQVTSSSGFLKFTVNSSGINAIGDTDLSDNNWHHIACVYDAGTSVKVYVDGSLQGTTTSEVPANLANVDQSLVIGSEGDGDSRFTGLIDEVAVWAYALDATDIAKIASKPSDLSKASSYVADRSSTLKLWLRAGDKVLPEEDTSIARSDFATAFDGGSEYVDCGLIDIPVHTNATMACWVKLDDFDATQFFGGSHNSKRWYFGITDGKKPYFGVADAYKSNGSALTINAGEWNHFALVADSGTATFYMNGIAKDTDTYTQASATNPDNPFLIGARNDGGTGAVSAVSPLDGNISSVKLYKTALDAQTIKQLSKSRFLPQRQAMFSVVDFDGTDDSIVTSGNVGISGSSARTLGLWFKPTATNQYYELIEWGGTGSANATCGLYLYNSKIFFYGWSSGDFDTGVAPLSTWQHLYATYDGTTVKVYLNGVSIGSSSESLNTSDTVLKIGNSQGNEFSGSISSVSIYNVAKTEQEIYALYQKGITYDESSENGLHAYYRMGDDTSKAYPTIADSSSNSNDGTITNGASDDIQQQAVAMYDMGAYDNSTEELGGSELANASSGNFVGVSSNDWTAENGNITFSNNQMIFERSGGNNVAIASDGFWKTYNMKGATLLKMTADVDSSTTGGWNFNNISQDASTFATPQTDLIAGQTMTAYGFLPTASNNAKLRLMSTGSDGDKLVLNSFEVKEVLQSDLSDTYPAIIDVANPTLGAELWDADASTFDSGTHSWVAYGNNTITNDSGALKITYVDQARGAYIWLKDASDLSTNLTVGAIYKITLDAKVNSGSSVTINVTEGLIATTTATVTETTFTKKIIYFTATETTTNYLLVQGMSSGEIVYIDNISMKEVQGNVGSMTSMATDNLTYSSVLPDQSSLIGVNSAYNFIDLDGTDAYVNTDNAFTTTFQDSFSISVWFKADDGQPSGTLRLFGSQNSADKAVQIKINTTGTIDCAYDSGNGNSARTASAVLSNGQETWHHLVAVVDNLSSQIYLYFDSQNQSLDGTLDGDLSSVTMSDYDSTRKVYIGARNNKGTAGNFFSGDIGQVSIFNKALSSSDASAIYDTGRHTNLLDDYSDNCVAYYAFGTLDAITGLADTDSTIYDRSGHSIQGTTVGTATGDLKSSPNAEPNGYAKGDTNRSTTIP